MSGRGPVGWLARWPVGVARWGGWHDGRVTVKHATASTFVFCRVRAGWHIGLILHPLFGRLMIPGGHVEPDETPPEAARREVAEESGLVISLAPAPAATLPAGLSDLRAVVAPPWWILEQPVPADNHLAEPHVHIDHLYVAVADSPESAAPPRHPFGWYPADGLAGLRMFADTRLLAASLFDDVEGLAALAAGRKV